MKFLISKKKLLQSFIISITLLIVGYFSNNMSIFTGESLETLAIMESINNFFGGQDEEETDSVIYINTSFDKELIQCYEKEDFQGAIPVQLGNTEITDRNKLIKLLELLRNVDYKYLIIDIKFAEGLESETYYCDSVDTKKIRTDEKLFSLINQLDRVVIATHHDIKLIDKEVEKKAALADYRSTATVTNFIRYEFFDSIPYIPLAVYNDLKKRIHQDTIACHYPFGFYSMKPFAIYTQGNKLCYNSLFLDFNINNKAGINEIGLPFISRPDYYNLSNDILEVDNPSSIVKNFKDHYIFIGNMIDDYHDTYAGPQLGSVILYKALKALDNNLHVISLTEILVLFFLYFSISLFILCGKNLFNFVGNSDNALVHFIVDTTTFTFVLSSYHIIDYMLSRTSFSFVVPIIVFSALKTYILLKKRYNLKNKMYIIIAILSGLLMSFTPFDNESCIKIHALNSDRILINGQKAKRGMMVSSDSEISFSHPKEYIVLLNQGPDISNSLKINGKDKKVIWKNGEYLKIQMSGDTHSNKLFWWIIWHATSCKGESMLDYVNALDSVEYVIGDRRYFRIQDRLVDFDMQYYEFIIIDGKHKGEKFISYPDDKEPLIWITKDHFGKYIDTPPHSLLFKVNFHNYGNIFTVKDSVKLVFIK